MPVNAAEIVRLRSSVPLTQAELAEKVAVSELAIWKIETGRTTNPRPTTIRALAKALGVTTDAIRITPGSCGA